MCFLYMYITTYIKKLLFIANTFIATDLNKTRKFREYLRRKIFTIFFVIYEVYEEKYRIHIYFMHIFIVLSLFCCINSFDSFKVT